MRRDRSNLAPSYHTSRASASTNHSSNKALNIGFSNASNDAEPVQSGLYPASENRTLEMVRPVDAPEDHQAGSSTELK